MTTILGDKEQVGKRTRTRELLPARGDIKLASCKFMPPPLGGRIFVGKILVNDSPAFLEQLHAEFLVFVIILFAPCGCSFLLGGILKDRIGGEDMIVLGDRWDFDNVVVLSAKVF